MVMFCGGNSLVWISGSQALHLWAMRLYGALPSVVNSNKGTSEGVVGEDEAETISRVVERFFEQGDNRVRYRELAQWIHLKGGTCETFRWREPGESKMKALLRRMWVQHLSEPCPTNSAWRNFESLFEEFWQTNCPPKICRVPLAEAIAPSRLRPFTTKEVSLLIGKSTSAVSNMVSRGHLLGHKFGPYWYIEPHSVEDYLKHRSNKIAS